MNIRIAAVTENGQEISNHFGMAPYYRVFTEVDGKVVSDETRAKPYHSQHPQGQHEEQGHSHEDMFAPISDCQVLLCGGMGTPAYRKALEAGLEVILTGGIIQEAVMDYLNGKAINEPGRIHQK